MRIIALAVLGSLTVASPGAVAADAPGPTGNLYFLGVAVDVEPEKGKTIDDYNWMVQYVERALRENSATLYKSIETKLILGKQANKQNILQGFAWVRQKMTANDVAIVYTESHGGTSKQEGFAMNAANGTEVRGRDYKTGLANIPGKVILFVDACGAGGVLWKGPAGFPEVPPNVAVICACRAMETTWCELLGGVMESLYGHADSDGNGIVTLAELMKHVQVRVPQYAEKVHPVMKQKANINFDLNLPLAKPTAPLLSHKDRPAIVQATEAARSQVYYPGLWVSENKWVPTKQLKPTTPPAAPGKP